MVAKKEPIEEWQGKSGSSSARSTRPSGDQMFEDNGVLTGALLERFWRACPTCV